MTHAQDSSSDICRTLRERISLFGIAVVASFLLFSNLGNHFLWQDEAQTANISRTILTHGVPLGFDGKNYFSSEYELEYGENYVWKWHTWLSFYLTAASFAVLGTTTFAARLPFALFGFAAVIVTYALAKRIFRNRRIALVATIALLISVPFLILSRQCRYYSLTMFFTSLSLFFYLGILERKKYSVPSFVISSTLLFHSHYIYSAALLTAVAFHALLFRRDQLKPVLMSSLALFMLNLPWIVWLSSIKYGEQYGENLFSLSQIVTFGKRYFYQIGMHVFPPVLLIIPVIASSYRSNVNRMLREKELRLNALMRLAAILVVSLIALAIVRHFHVYSMGMILLGTLVWTVWRKTPLAEKIALPVLVIGATLCALLFSIPYPFFRYLAPLIPVFCLLMAVAIEKAMEIHISVGAMILLLLALNSPLREFLYEITHDYDGPVEGIVTYLNDHASRTDTVVITYEDLPLKFYTELKVAGGLTGENIAPYVNAQWIILRKHDVAPTGIPIKNELKRSVRWENYARITIPYPDIPYENREDPLLHLYRTAPVQDSVVIYRRVR